MITFWIAAAGATLGGLSTYAYLWCRAELARIRRERFVGRVTR